MIIRKSIKFYKKMHSLKPLLQEITLKIKKIYGIMVLHIKMMLYMYFFKFRQILMIQKAYKLNPMAQESFLLI
jgi:hypothetical protein